MPQDILVVEYEPRYTERVKQALSGQPFTPLFAKDGEEALRTLEGRAPSLIVLSSVIPRISTTELIRMIRTRPQLAHTPILVTVSGYNGKAPKSDAGKIGASDILPKPYSEAEFLGKLQTMLGLKADQPVGAPAWTGDVESEFVVHQGKPAIPDGMKADAGALTSNEIFGDIFEDDKPAAAATAKAAPPSASPSSAASKQQNDLDKILAETLSGARVPNTRRAESAKPVDAPKPPMAPDAKAAAAAEAKAKSGAELDRLLEDTLSGLEKPLKFKTADQPKPAPVAAAPAAAAPAATPPAATPPAATRPAAPPPAATPPAAAPTPAPAPKPQASPAPPPAPVRAAENVVIASPVIPPVQEKSKEKEKEEAEEASGVRFGQYLLQDRIATGGMAEVWKARMRGVEGFQKVVAIKKILPHLSDNEEFVTMFIDEAKLAAQLNHNNIIHIYDLGKIANSYYIAMEYIDGHDLKTILKRGEERGQPMPADLAIFVASKIASALDYAHRKRDLDEHEMELVHRDVSPQNVLISHEGDIKLCDFGIAKAASKASHTQAGALKGKLQYMSPEQAWGKKIDRRSDIFALAAVLFEMLTGRKLFAGDSEISILEQVREAKVSQPSEVNDEVTPEIDAIVLKALKKEPDERYQTAGEMARDLDAVLYSFRPTPTSADLAIHMHRLYSAEPLPVVQSSVMMEPVEEDSNIVSIKPAAVAPVAAAPTPAPAAVGSMFGAQVAQREKKLPIVPIAIGAVAVVAIAIGGFFAMRGKSSAPVPAALTSTAPSTVASATVPSATASTATLPTATTGTSPDQASVDEEVKKRLEAERLKLEQQRAQQVAQTATQAPVQQTAPAPAPAPQPVVQQPPPQPAPVVTEAPPPVVETRSEPPAAAQPAAARAREGDLVPAGTDGLVPPEIVTQYRPPYPQIARAQKVQGVVVVSALVSETGRVIQATVLRGIPQLNDAALEAVRRTTFRPATKDGVRVKSYKTVTVPFKL